MLGDGVGGGDRDIPIDTILIHGEGRDGAARITNRKPCDARANGLDFAGRFLAEPSRQLRGPEVRSRAKHRLGPIASECTNSNSHLPRVWRTDVQLVELQHFGATGRWKRTMRDVISS